MTESHGGAFSTSITVFSQPSACPRNVALILGATGLVGRELARALLLRRPGWRVYGVARNRPEEDGPMPLLSPSHEDRRGEHRFVVCDLLDSEETARNLSPLSREVTHVFWVTWSSQFPLDTPECCAQNTSMMANVLNALLPGARVLRHIALQTGVKHYVSLLRPTPGEGEKETDGREDGYCCYDEDSPRVPAEQGGRHNFYYALEDMLRERLAEAAAKEKPERCRISWSVHRPGLLLGASRRACFNFVGTLCVYGAVCRRLGLPFLFGGDRWCWEHPYLDVSDARLVAEQQVWASSTPQETRQLAGDAFNAVSGSRFTWREIWPALAAKFVGSSAASARAEGQQAQQVQGDGDVDRDGFFSPSFTYTSFMADKGAVWEEMVEAEGLRRTKVEDLACWPFLDNLFRCPARMLVRRPGMAEALGFHGGRATECGGGGDAGVAESILYWVDQMRAERLVPF